MKCQRSGRVSPQSKSVSDEYWVRQLLDSSQCVLGPKRYSRRVGLNTQIVAELDSIIQRYLKSHPVPNHFLNRCSEFLGRSKSGGIDLSKPKRPAITCRTWRDKRHRLINHIDSESRNTGNSLVACARDRVALGPFCIPRSTGVCLWSERMLGLRHAFYIQKLKRGKLLMNCGQLRPRQNGKPNGGRRVHLKKSSGTHEISRCLRGGGWRPGVDNALEIYKKELIVRVIKRIRCIIQESVFAPISDNVSEYGKAVPPEYTVCASVSECAPELRCRDSAEPTSHSTPLG